MTFLWIALAVLREVSSREPQCVVALLAGLLGVLFAMRRRFARAVVDVAGAVATGGRGATGGTTAPER